MKRRRFTGLALASAAVVTTQGMPRRAQAQSLRLTGAGAELPLPALLDLVPDLQPADLRHPDRLPVDGQRCRREVVHRAHGRLRRQRRGDDGRADRPGRGRRGAVADDCRRDRAGLQPARRHRPQAAAGGLSADLPGRGHRAGRTRASSPPIPGVDAARHQYHRRPPVGRQRHDLRVHQPPRRDQREVQEHGHAGHQPAVAGRQQPGGGARATTA